MTKKKYRINESGFHKHAKEDLASWVGGIVEQPFVIDGRIIFVPDVTCYKDGFIDRVYEIWHKHPVDGKKLGMIQYWCFMNATNLSVFEVDADFILRQTKKPEKIDILNYYEIEVL